MSGHDELLTRIAGEVFEQLAFMFSDPGEEPPEPPPGGLVEVEMGFEGPSTGRLRLAAPHELGQAAAAGMLGLEPEDGEALDGARDVLQEILNVICGHLVTELFGEGPLVRMSVPETRTIPENRWRDLVAGESSIVLCVDDWPVLLALEL